MTLRVAFLGNDPWSVPSLDAIAAEPELSLALVVTNPPKEAGRGAALTPTAVAKAAAAHGAPVLEVGGVLDGPGATGLAEAATCTSPCCLDGGGPRPSSVRSRRAMSGRA